MQKLAILGPKGTYSDQAASLLEEVMNEIKNRIEQQESCHLEVLGLYNKVE
ncbi:MAG: hypothetical protein K2P14_07990 [Anaeroplasmataceae bacterium]|nr:hypothetical protein [Anaeroplasmataceae bacterium]